MADKVKVFKYKIVDDSGDVVEKSTSKLSVLEEAVKKTSDALKGADIGSEKWKELKSGLDENEKSLTKAQIKTEGLASTLGKVGGPIGGVIQGFTGMGKAATAFIANPIGLVIAALGVVFGAVTKAINNSEKAMDGITKITAIFGGIVRPIFEFIEKTAVGAINLLAKGLEIVSGLFGDAGKAAGDYADALDDAEDTEKKLAVTRAETNKQLAEAREILSDTNARYEDRVAALKKVQTAEEAQSKKEIENKRELKRLAEEDIRINGESETSVQKLRDAKIALYQAEQDGAAKQRLFNKEQKKLDAEKDAADKQRAKEADDRRKEDLANRKAAADKIRQLDEENTLASIENEKERDIKAQEFAKAAAIREINQMKLTKQEKARLIEEIDEKNKLKLEEIDQKYKDKQAEKDKEDADKKKEFEKQVAEALAVSREEQFQKEQNDIKTQYDELIKQAGENKELVIQLQNAKNAKLKEGQDKYNADTLAATEETTQKQIALEKALADFRGQSLDKGLANVAAAGALLGELAGKNKKIAIAGVVIEQGAAVGKVLVDTSRAIAQANASAAPFIANPLTAPVGAATLSATLIQTKIAAGLSIAGIVAGAAKAIADINSADTEGGGGAGGNSKKIATSYAQGGLLTGKRHGQGGIATPMGELEGGEFVVNRKSTASFLPLLTSINEMGAGGILGSGNVSSGIENAGLNTPPPIIKTYVVASDVSSQQEADKMISDLARL